MTVVALTSDFLLDRLNSLPPHSRKRAGYCDLLKEIRKRELQHEALHRECVGALEDALLRDLTFALTAGMVL